jgi:hypothetical protein
LSERVLQGASERTVSSTSLAGRALAVFGATWSISGLMLLIAGRHQQGTAQFASTDPWNYYVFRALPNDPGFFGIITNWDGQWYQRLATLGYLPSDADPLGFAARAWDFPPAYPWTVRLFADALAVDVPVAAWVVSSVFAGAAMVLLALLTYPRLGSFGALSLVAVTGCYITAPLLQAAYAESMALFFLLWTMWELSRRHYARALLPLLALSFTRLIAPPLAVVAAVHLVVRVRSGEPVSNRDRLLLSSYAVLALVGPFLWSTVGGWLQGSDVVSRAGSRVGAADLGWFDILWTISPWVVLVPAVLSLWFVRLAWSERERLGADLATWAAAYPIFVFVVTAPTPGFLRYFMFAFPFGVAAVGTIDMERSRRLVGVLAICAGMLVLQYLWVRYSFVIDPQPGRPVLNP